MLQSNRNNKAGIIGVVVTHDPVPKLLARAHLERLLVRSNVLDRVVNHLYSGPLVATVKMTWNDVAIVGKVELLDFLGVLGLSVSLGLGLDLVHQVVDSRHNYIRAPVGAVGGHPGRVAPTLCAPWLRASGK